VTQELLVLLDLQGLKGFKASKVILALLEPLDLKAHKVSLEYRALLVILVQLV
jgi:hypothetical protein